MSFAEPLAYLIVSLFLLGLALLALARAQQRRVLLLGGWIALPNAILELVFIPSYWSPSLVLGGPFGLEDLIFSFSAGVLSCSLALAPWRRRWRLDLTVRRMAARWLGLEALFLLLFGILLLAGSPVMTAALLGMGGVASFLCGRSRSLALLALSGGLGFALLYPLVLALAFALWPSWADAWNSSQLLDLRPLGVFSEEWAWALAFGSVHAWATGYIVGLRST